MRLNMPFFQLRISRTVFAITPVAQLATAQCMVSSVAEPESTSADISSFFLFFFVSERGQVLTLFQSLARFGF